MKMLIATTTRRIACPPLGPKLMVGRFKIR
jgi:hypothetical protein